MRNGDETASICPEYDGKFFIHSNEWEPARDGNKTGGLFAHTHLCGKGKKVKWCCASPRRDFTEFVPQWFRDLPVEERADLDEHTKAWRNGGKKAWAKARGF